MICPFCEFAGPRPDLHAHLTNVHQDKVDTVTTLSDRRYYELACPLCDQSWRQEIKPRLRDPGFLDEYAREIRIVAFDQFLYHVQVDHEKEEAGA